MLRVLYMKYTIFFYLNPSFRTFFSRIRIRIFLIRIRIFGRSGSGLRKKTRIRNTDSHTSNFDGGQHSVANFWNLFLYTLHVTRYHTPRCNAISLSPASFLTELDQGSGEVLRGLLEKYVTGGREAARLLRQPIPAPTNNNQHAYINVGGFWISQVIAE